MTTRLRALAAVAAAVLLVGCVPEKTQVSPEDSATPSTGGTASPGNTQGIDVYEQDVEWSQCGELDCATVQVPLDWSEPDGATISVAINRYPARDQDARIGSLLINPGGPGASGLDYTEVLAASAGDELVDAYDIVGFDPRGVGESTAIACGTSAQIDEYFLPDRPITSQADIDEWDRLNAEFAELCQAGSGRVAENVDTASVAKDMDVLRAILGDDKLHYLGFSYGTQLGATYAELFPENVGRLVLDGAVDFLLPGDEVGAQQAEGFESALTAFLQWCTGKEECALGNDVEQARTTIQDLLDTAKAEPYYTGTNLDLNGNLMIYGIVVTLYDEGSWDYLEQGLAEVIEQSTGGILLFLANFYLDRSDSTGEYLSNSQVAFTAINCLDADTSDVMDLADYQETKALMEEASPTFGWWFASSTGCQNWPWTADVHITSLDQAATAGDNILVIGTTNDPATPYAWAQSLSERLGSTLLTYEGEGHTAYGRSNQCIIDAVDGFLVGGQMPDSGTEC
ncbi:alpha/beta hydrolase [Demequina sp.]|uniref:alpha/beta hydrolase n=1 Tax=Demequina sp. TaxID=2050685 RepID=UPI003A83C592